MFCQSGTFLCIKNEVLKDGIYENKSLEIMSSRNAGNTRREIIIDINCELTLDRKSVV